MRALEETIRALGPPVILRPLGASSRPPAAIARWRHGPGVVDVAPSDAIRLAVSLVDSRNARSRGGVAGDRGGRGGVSVFSPSEGVSVEVSGEADVVQLFLDPDHVETALDIPFTCPPMLNLQDDGLRAITMRLLVSGVRPDPDQALRVEQDLHALARRLGRHAARWREPPATAMFRGGLSPAAFRRVEAMISAALLDAGSPSLAELATAAGLSVSYFGRAFRRHTGLTPHQYLVRRRMDLAVSLLRRTGVPIAEVADQAGFSTPAHFVATFRSTLGVTPGALRDALAG